MPSWVIPSPKPLPPYKGWSHTHLNTPTVVTGHRLFYTDGLGETVPVSDDDEDPETIAAIELAGPQRPKHDYIIRRITGELGMGREICAAIAGCMRLASGAAAVQARAQELARQAEHVLGQHSRTPPGGPLTLSQGPAQLQHSLLLAWCRQCRIYGCRMHQTAPLPVIGPVRVRHAKTAQLEPTSCGPDCWLAPAPRAAGEGPGSASGPAGPAVADLGSGCAWSDWEQEALEQGMLVWGSNPCALSLILGTRGCAEVGTELKRRALPPTSPVKSPSNNRRKPAGGKRVKLGRPAAVRERLRRQGTLWAPYVPCDCVGGCVRGSCPCLDSANFCEKFCACDARACGNRFPGCKCSYNARRGGRCWTTNCPCMAAGRECDPDLCGGCVSTLGTSGRAGPGGERGCANFRLRHGVRKRVLMGLSNVQGWGAFLQGNAKAGDYVGEYVGELIDNQEAERRGKGYDRDDNSYLFNLNEHWVVDAKTKGTKLRFANHSASANCRAEILMVDGDHRVAIVAKKNIKDGEELFYNYNYDKRVAPDWAHDGQRDTDSDHSR